MKQSTTWFVYSAYRPDKNTNQSGTALLLAMIMIFMLSIMGVSAMRGSTLEKKMATNAIQSSVTFQAAESASDLVLNTPRYLTAAFDSGIGSETEVDIDAVTSNIGLQSTSTLQYIGNQPAAGFSTGVNASSFDSLLFVSTGVSRIDNVRSQSTVEQGAYRVVPSKH